MHKWVNVENNWMGGWMDEPRSMDAVCCDCID